MKNLKEVVEHLKDNLKHSIKEDYKQINLLKGRIEANQTTLTNLEAWEKSIDNSK